MGRIAPVMLRVHRCPVRLIADASGRCDRTVQLDRSEKQSDFQRACSQVIESLTSGERREYRRGLVLHDNLVVHHHINPLRCQRLSFVRNGYYHLSFDGIPSFQQLSLER
jgi:hypothetical protein